MKRNIFNQNKIQSLQRWVFVPLGIVILLCLGTVYSWSVFKLPIVDLFDAGYTLSGLPYMTALAFYAIFMLITGRFLDKSNPRLFLIGGSLLVSLGYILSSFAPDVYVLTITYGIISGAGVGIVYGAPLAVVARWFPEKQGVAVGLVLIGFGLSPLVTAPVANYLVGNFGVMTTFLIIGISFGVLIPLLSLPFKYPTERDRQVLKEKSASTNSAAEIQTSKMVKTKNFKGLYLNFIIGSMVGLMLIGLTNNVGVELIRLSTTDATLLLAMFAIFNGIGRPLFGWFTDKLSIKKAMLISYGLIFLSAVLMLFAQEGSVVLFAIAFSIFWLNLGGWLAIAPASTLSLYGTKNYNQNYGVVFTAYGLGAIIGVITSGLFLDILHSFQPIFYFVLGISVLGMFLAQLLIAEKA